LIRGGNAYFRSCDNSYYKAQVRLLSKDALDRRIMLIYAAREKVIL